MSTPLKRPVSSLATPIRSRTLSVVTPDGERPTTPSAPGRIRAAVTAGSVPRKKAPNLNRPPSVSRGASPLPGSRPSSPLKFGVAGSRSSSPAKQSASRPSSPTKPATGLFPSLSNLDIDFDYESSLIDWKTVEDGDVSIELGQDEDGHQSGTEDKVLVTVRLKPPSGSQSVAWTADASTGQIKLDQAYARTAASNVDYQYDNVLTGSENKPIYVQAAKSHVRAAMEGYNAVVFAYGQTASGKTFTLSGSENEPGIIPRAMRDVFNYIKQAPDREFLLRASYLEIYKEQIYDLLGSGVAGGTGLNLQDNGVVPGLREEVVTSVKGLKDVLERGEANRRTASTDWNARSSRSHSVFRLIIESREAVPDDMGTAPLGCPPTPGGSRLQAKGGRSVRTSMLSLIDLAGSERATSDRERTTEGKYINTSLLTLGTVIGTLADNAGKKRQDFVPYRNSKLTKLLQPSLSGNARISVICTLNITPASVTESISTLSFASRVKRVHLNAQKKEIVNTDALIERYKREIEELKARLTERERDNTAVRRRPSTTKEKNDENRAMRDLSARIKQLTKLILTSQNVAGNMDGMDSRPASPSKLDFTQSPYELQEQLLQAMKTIESQATQILSLEATLSSRPLFVPENEKDRTIEDLRRTVRELEVVNRGYEENLGAPLRKVREDVEQEWFGRMSLLEEKYETKLSYVEELERALEREKQARIRVEQQKIALIGFVREIDTHISSSALITPSSSFASFQPVLSPLSERNSLTPTHTGTTLITPSDTGNSLRKQLHPQTVSLLEEDEVEFLVGVGNGDESFDRSPAKGKENVGLAM